MKKEYKNYLIAALYFVVGILTWVSASYIFNSATAYLIPSTFSFMKLVHWSFGTSDTALLLYTTSKVIIAFIYVSLLSMATGKRHIWIIMFIIGATALPLYQTIRNHIEFYKYDLPVWGTLISSLTTNCIIIPFLTWLGATLGNKYQIKRQHNNSVHTDAE